MKKSIHTLVEDVYGLVKRLRSGVANNSPSSLPEDNREFIEHLSRSISGELSKQFGQSDTSRASLRMSQLGARCPCALWHSIHTPEFAEPLPPWAEIKYTYGHILEALLISLAKEAGHEVAGEQDVLVLDGIVGHRDCVIDGCVVDVKSAASRSFVKFKDKSIAVSDTFGYLEQLDAYVVASADDPLVTVKDRGYLWAIDKQLGHMVLYEHVIREAHIRKRIGDYKAIVALDRPPRCTCEEVPQGKSGNIALGTVASYSQYKYCCKPHLRTFIYADGPVYLTHVVRKPDVPEVDKLGNFIYG